MLKVLDLIGLLFIISIFPCCHSASNEGNEDDTSLKIALVEDILQKVCNISLSTFGNKSAEEKIMLLKIIEDKLQKSAQTLGVQGEKYVKLIMEGVRSKAFANENLASNNTLVTILGETAKYESRKSEIHQLDLRSKDQIAHDIAIKIESIVKSYLDKAETKEERNIALQNIKKKFVETAVQKQASLYNKQADVKHFTDLIDKGIDLMMKKYVDNAKKRQMNFEYNGNINLNKDSQDQNDEVLNPIRRDSFSNNKLENYMEDNIKPKTIFLKPSNDYDLDPPIQTPCDDALRETCTKIKLMKTFQCLSSNKEFSVIKLCDGVVDCLDFSDEQLCAKQGIEAIQKANQVIKYIDNSLSRNCYPDAMDEGIILKQNEILSNVLQNLLGFLQGHSVDGSSVFSKRVFSKDTKSITKTVSDAVMVVDSLASALESALCQKTNNFKSRALGQEAEAEKEVVDYESTTVTLQFCQCKGQHCAKKCNPECSKICWEKFSLSRWQCSAVSGERTVSLDVLCDGKFDCYDETDEKDCTRDVSLAKFEATKMYSFLLQMLKTKASGQSFEPLRNKFLSLCALITRLEKLSLKRFFDVLEVKRVREESFAMLTSIYESALRYLQATDLLDIYVYLLTVNERLVSAMKRSHTGNDKIISPDGCVCRGYQCALPKCSKSCIRACSAEPKLTRYFCSDTIDYNNSVPIDVICNGKPNCPHGDDEKDCNREVCRAHNLVVLRHHLRDVGKLQKGTALGEALRSWRVKVIATLTVAERNDRPTPAVMRDIIHDILHDLVMTYATVEENRRSDSVAIFSEFYTWSRVVMDTLKSCSK